MPSIICEPCKICGRNDSFTQRGLCQVCWILTRDLPFFLSTPGGLMFVKQCIPVLDDWVDGHPDAWDYESVLKENEVTVFQGEQTELLKGWYMSWKHGTMYFGLLPETWARKAAALFVSLWVRNVSASFADKLVAGYIMYLNFQESQQ